MIFWTKLTQKSYFWSRTVKVDSQIPSNSTYSSQSRNEILSKTNNVDFLDQICPERVFSVQKILYHRNRYIQNKSRYQISSQIYNLNVWTKFVPKRLLLV